MTTGLFVSPHIASFRERMQVNGTYITEEEVVRLLPVVFNACEKYHIPATFFEITTAVSFLHFASKGCQSVVMEVRLNLRARVGGWAHSLTARQSHGEDIKSPPPFMHAWSRWA